MLVLQRRTWGRDPAGFVCEAHGNSPAVWDVSSTYFRTHSASHHNFRDRRNFSSSSPLRDGHLDVSEYKLSTNISLNAVL